MSCQHRGALHTMATVQRLEGDGAPTHLDIEVACATCGRPFRFKGLVDAGPIAPGPSALQDMGLEIRLPIEPIVGGRA
jgi:hypothetical protein